MKYKPVVTRVPNGYQGLIGCYENGEFTGTIVNDDAVFDNEITALHHAQNEIIRQDKLNYCVQFLRKNWNKLKNFEKEGYMGLDLSYQPHGIKQEIWKEAYSFFCR